MLTEVFTSLCEKKNNKLLLEDKLYFYKCYKCPVFECKLHLFSNGRDEITDHYISVYM